MKIKIKPLQIDLMFQWAKQRFGLYAFFYEFFDIETEKRFVMEKHKSDEDNEIHMFTDHTLLVYREPLDMEDPEDRIGGDIFGFIIYHKEGSFYVQAVFGERIGESVVLLETNIADEQLEEEYGHLLDRYLLKETLEQNTLAPEIWRG